MREDLRIPASPPLRFSGSCPSEREGGEPGSGSQRVFRRNPVELVWLLCVLVLGVAFALTSASLAAPRLAARFAAGQRDLLVDGMWVLACTGIFVVVGLVGRELVRFLRKRVVADPRGLRVGSVFFPWEQVVEAREARQFRTGAWFYVMEIRGRNGERAWVTSGLIADYPVFRTELLRRCPGLRLTLLPD